MSWTEVGKKSDFTNISSSHSAIQHFFFFLVGAGGGGGGERMGKGREEWGGLVPFSFSSIPSPAAKTSLI